MAGFAAAAAPRWQAGLALSGGLWRRTQLDAPAVRGPSWWPPSSSRGAAWLGLGCVFVAGRGDGSGCCFRQTLLQLRRGRGHSLPAIAELLRVGRASIVGRDAGPAPAEGARGGNARQWIKFTAAQHQVAHAAPLVLPERLRGAEPGWRRPSTCAGAASCQWSRTAAPLPAARGRLGTPAGFALRPGGCCWVDSLLHALYAQARVDSEGCMVA